MLLLCTREKDIRLKLLNEQQLMKVSLASDLHLEFGDLVLKNEDQANVLILSGDIFVAKHLTTPGEQGKSIKNFFSTVSTEFPHTVLIMGNHEHYNGDFTKTQQIIESTLSEIGIKNIYLLEKSKVEINGFLFVGGTLWTDFNKEDPVSMVHAQWKMNDFDIIKNITRPFLPRDALKDHKNMKNYIQEILNSRRDSGINDKNVIIVGHHAPSRQSTHPKYQNEVAMNGCYSSSLDEFILDNPEIVLWTHGHTHEDFDYMIGTTRVMCNPRGYAGYEARTSNFKLKTIEL